MRPPFPNEVRKTSPHRGAHDVRVCVVVMSGNPYTEQSSNRVIDARSSRAQPRLIIAAGACTEA